MKAVIMAGGEGTRLRPITSTRPKPMVPIVNKPVMEHILGLVKHHGIDEVVATLAFLPQVIQAYFGDGGEWGMEVSYALEETPLGTAGSVKNAEHLLDSDEPFVVISGDAMTDIDLSEVIAFHRSKGAAVTIALKSVPEPLEFGVVITDDDGRIERFLEKPTWGQVFSDTINTGIYVIEPEVMKYIPEGEPFDFSSQLFPLLMDKGYPLYGCVVDGYWCDVGSLATYMQCHRDILAGDAMVFIPGVEARDGLWIGEGTHVDPEAEIGDRIVLGANVQIRAGARLGGSTVVGDNCVIGNGAHVSHSVIWGDTFVGRDSSVDGAVLCRHVDVRSRSHIGIGAVIGDETMIGHGAHIGPDVQIYPHKRIEPSAVVNTSIIWENMGQRSLFEDGSISGLIGVDITPEKALRAAQAFGTILPKGSHVVVSRDTSRGARMVKRAMVAGLNSTGCHTRDLRVASQAVNRFTTRDTRCVGGVHICEAPTDPQSLQIHLYDASGLDVAPGTEKKIERLYFREEFRRAFFNDVGDIIYPPRALEYYTAGLVDARHDKSFSERWRKIVVDFDGGVASIVMPHVMSGWHINMLALNPFIDAETTRVPFSPEDTSYEDLGHALTLFAADLGIRFERSGERIDLVTPAGRILEGNTALHAVLRLWCSTDKTGLPAAVPLGASSVCEQIAASTGHQIVRPGSTRRSLAALACEGEVGFAGSMRGGFIFPDFLASYDGVVAALMITRMLDLVGEDLDEVVDGLPACHKKVTHIFCPVDRKGAVMRTVTEAAVGLEPNLTEGVRVTSDDGWALVLPHSSEPLVSVSAEGTSKESTERLMAYWTALVEDSVDAG